MTYERRIIWQMTWRRQTGNKNKYRNYFHSPFPNGKAHVQVKSSTCVSHWINVWLSFGAAALVTTTWSFRRLRRSSLNFGKHSIGVTYLSPSLPHRSSAELGQGRGGGGGECDVCCITAPAQPVTIATQETESGKNIERQRRSEAETVCVCLCVREWGRKFEMSLGSACLLARPRSSNQDHFPYFSHRVLWGCGFDFTVGKFKVFEKKLDTFVFQVCCVTTE